MINERKKLKRPGIKTMKKLLLILLLNFSYWSFGQNLNLYELEKLRTMAVDDVETYLTQMDWNYKDGEPEEDGNLGFVDFVYGASDHLGFGEAFLTFYYSKDGANRIVVQITKQTKYEEYLQSIKKVEAPLIFTGFEEGDLVQVYQGEKSTFIFKTTTVKNRAGEKRSSWRLMVFDNQDYYFSDYRSNLKR